MPLSLDLNAIQSFTIDEALNNVIQVRGGKGSGDRATRDRIARVMDDHHPLLLNLQSKLKVGSGFRLTDAEEMAVAIFCGIEWSMTMQPKGGYAVNTVRKVDFDVVDRQVKVIEWIGPNDQQRMIILKP